MTRIKQLRLEALESCRFRGHDMERFVTYQKSATHEMRGSRCKVCGKPVVICISPSISNVGGQAVALGCKD